MWRTILAIVLVTVAIPARGAWVSATSRHFVVYADSGEDKVRAMATELEQFDSVIRTFHSLPDAPEASSNRLTVYVVSGVDTVQRLCGKCGNVAGFYLGRASGSVAYTPARGDGDGEGGKTELNPRTVLFHEYAHHFLLGNYALAYPAWFSEGYAELVSTMRATPDKYLIGAAANHRAYALFSIDVPIERLFASATDRPLRGQEVDALYARGWLLTHYLLFSHERAGQLDRYLKLLNTGTPSLAAAKATFGDLKALDKALDRYMRSPRLSAMIIAHDKIATPAITLRTLTPGERALIDARMVSDRGVDLAQAKALYARAARIAVHYPDDAVAQGWFAEMAYDAGEDSAALAAADRALAAHPNDSQALLYKANTDLRRLAAQPADAKAWGAARGLIVDANRQDPNNAYPLVLFYQSFGQEHREPSKSAIAGLYRALELVPQDDGVRWAAAQQSIEDDDLDGAKRLLRPLAFSPHAAADNAAARLLVMLDASKSKDEVHAAMAAAAEQAKAAVAKAAR